MGGTCTQGKAPISAKIKGDGNCYFRAISYSICGEEIYHADIMNAVCDFISTFDADLKPFLVKGKGKEYILKSKHEEYGYGYLKLKSCLLWKYYIKMYSHTIISNGWGILISRSSLLMLCTWITVLPVGLSKNKHTIKKCPIPERKKHNFSKKRHFLTLLLILKG